MHFILAGPGALGSLLSYVIAKGLTDGDSLTIADYDKDRAAYLRDSGLLYEKDGKKEKIKVSAISEPRQDTPVDILLICVKSYDVPACLEFYEPLLQPKRLVVFWQNGISHLAIREHLGDASCAYGTTTEGATLIRSGHVRHAGSGITFLGFDRPPEPHAVTLLTGLQRVLTKAGLQVELTDTILSQLWSKLLVNTGINGLTAIYSCKNGELLGIPEREQRLEKAVLEAKAIAKAQNIPVQDNPVEATRLVCQKTAQNISSMLQDVQKQKRTEIEAINGAVIQFGRQTGIATPENQRIFEQVKRLEASYLS